MFDEEEELIEQLNEINPAWRDDFDDVWEAARVYGLADQDDDDDTYKELDFT